MNKIGLYLHVPFCISKCPYCDFYSMPSLTPDLADRYTRSLMEAMDRYAHDADVTADTLYFGGGTPSLLGGERLARLVSHADKRFGLLDGDFPEITMEANPADDLRDVFAAFAAAGGNRVSLGMQSAHDNELRRLGRRHTDPTVERAVAAAQTAGIANVSLDLMLGIPEQTVSSAVASARRAVELGARHVSAYMLKLEPATPFGQHPPSLPDDDGTADVYLAVMQELDSHGFCQYEISNTALDGYHSRHNLKYWTGEPYLGLGPAASSYWQGRRFVYPWDMDAFMAGKEPQLEQDEAIPTASPQEYAMLRLRLTDGLTQADFSARYGAALPTEWLQRAHALPPSLVRADAAGIRLTRDGFLLSNSLICHILGI